MPPCYRDRSARGIPLRDWPRYTAAMDCIEFNGEATLSFRQIDELNGFRKGTAFRVFKHAGPHLEEGVDFYYLPQSQFQKRIDELRHSGHIYVGTSHLVLITRSGYERLKASLADRSD